MSPRLIYLDTNMWNRLIDQNVRLLTSSFPESDYESFTEIIAA
jgi:hypothetical protein